MSPSFHISLVPSMVMSLFLYPSSCDVSVAVVSVPLIQLIKVVIAVVSVVLFKYGARAARFVVVKSILEYPSIVVMLLEFFVALLLIQLVHF